MKASLWVGLLWVLVSCSKAPTNAVEAYLRDHPETLVETAQALRQNELVIEMLIPEVKLLLGEPMGVSDQFRRGQNFKILSFRSDCRLRLNEKVEDFQGPISIEFLEHTNIKGEVEWRLVSVRSIWR